MLPGAAGLGARVAPAAKDIAEPALTPEIFSSVAVASQFTMFLLMRCVWYVTKDLLQNRVCITKGHATLAGRCRIRCSMYVP